MSDEPVRIHDRREAEPNQLVVALADVAVAVMQRRRSVRSDPAAPGGADPDTLEGPEP